MNNEKIVDHIYEIAQADKTIRSHNNRRHMKDAFNELYELCVNEGDDTSIKVLKIVENIMNNHWEVN